MKTTAETKTTVMIVDDNVDWVNEVCAQICDEYDVVATAFNGEDGLQKFNELRPKVVVLDLVMPVRDGFAFLDNVHKGDSVIVVLSALSQDSFVNRATSSGADYYLVKPCSASVLKKTIASLVADSDESITINTGFASPGQTSSFAPKRVVDKVIEERITNIFITVGIPAHIKGYQFLREAIKMAVDNPEIINSITKKLYPSVAQRFATSPSKVERAIRHAIEVAWNRGKIENINSLFGVRVYNHNEKPTNGEFIALVADKMLLESV